MKKTLGLIALFIAIPLGYWYYSAKASANGQPKYRVGMISRGDIEVTVSATGTINPTNSVEIGSQISGVLSALYVDFNSQVKQGDLIAQIEPSTYQARLLQAQAALEKALAAEATAEARVMEAQSALDSSDAEILSAEANIKKIKPALMEATDNFKRSEGLFQKGIHSSQEFQKAQVALSTQEATLLGAEASVKVANARRKSAGAGLESSRSLLKSAKIDIRQREIEVELARLELGRTSIYSPIDGIVINRAVDVGQTVAASLSAPTLFIIAQDLRQMQIDTNIDEADIGKVTEGIKVNFTVDAFPEDRFHGMVRQVRLNPTITQNIVTYNVVVGVDNPDLKLRPGMTANVSLQIADRRNCLRVPLASLIFIPPGEKIKTKTASSTNAVNRSGPDKGRREGHERRDRTLWLYQSDEIITQARVGVGLSDNQYTEIIPREENSIREGLLVVTGLNLDSVGSAKSNNPLAPTRRGGGRGIH